MLEAYEAEAVTRAQDQGVRVRPRDIMTSGPQGAWGFGFISKRYQRLSVELTWDFDYNTSAPRLLSCRPCRHAVQVPIVESPA